jgi:hypothetical protein
MQDRRNSASPIPSDPGTYINEQQVHGLIILKKFGWNLVCIRRYNGTFPSIILNNRNEGRVGVLQYDGVLKLRDDLEIRNQKINEVATSDEITKDLLFRFAHHLSAGWLEGEKSSFIEINHKQ